MSERGIAIVGAGMAGLACAHALAEAGENPVVFEKSRGLGGRLATRRHGDGSTTDHGAQYVTARGPDFRAYIAGAAAAGSAAVWREHKGEDWHVGCPGMSGLVAPLAEGLEIRRETTIDRLAREGDGWRVGSAVAGGAVSGGAVFGRVVLAIPAPQALRLAAGTDLEAPLAAVRMAPCWALLMRTRGTLLGGADHLRPDPHTTGGAIAWIARSSSRPGRTPPPDGTETWIVHAGPEWSTAHLEHSADAAAALLRAELAAELDAALGTPLPDIADAAAHRWRYAMTTEPAGRPFLASADGTLLAGGDWALGARVEAAFESGRAMAAALLSRR